MERLVFQNEDNVYLLTELTDRSAMFADVKKRNIIFFITVRSLNWREIPHLTKLNAARHLVHEVENNKGLVVVWSKETKKNPSSYRIFYDMDFETIAYFDTDQMLDFLDKYDWEHYGKYAQYRNGEWSNINIK